jgi:hypothetical protein
MKTKLLARVLAAPALVAVIAGVLAGADCGSSTGCDCTACNAAITLNVADEAGEPLDDDDRWVVEATVNGQPVGEPTPCAIGTRTNNQCAFGDQPGVYELTIRAPGFETLETVARFPERTGVACCGACVVGETVSVRLHARP